MSEKPVILFESYPDFSGSPLEIYNELVKRGYDKKYDLIWAVYSTFNEKTNYKVVKFHGCNTPEKRNILARTKLIIDSNRYIQKPRPDCFRLHVRHGFPFKYCKGYFDSIGYVDAIITSSEEIKKLDEKIYSKIKDKLIITGMPVLDRLFSKTDLYANGFIKELTQTDTKFNKIIGWLPTFRKHRFGGPQVGKVFRYGLPVIKSVDDYKKLNAELEKQGILLIIQMHHAQAANYEKLPKVSNISFVTEELKRKYNLTTHNLMSAFDGFITDYSAAYHEYIILNRPIALTCDDLVEYSRTEGFCCNYLEWIKGDYILDCDELIKWINDIGNGIDRSKKERELSLHKIHAHIDNHSTERVIKFLLDRKVLEVI